MAVFTRTEALTATEAFDEAPAAIALLGGACLIERATALFLDLYGGDDVRFPSHQSEVEQIVSGELNHLTVMLDGVEAEICAVLARDGQRYALLTIPVDVYEGDGANPLLDKPIDASSAIIWLKDLDGRYLRVNGRYTEQLQTEAERVRGKTDGELSPSESIEGARVRANVVGAHEPLELEYTLPASADQPAFAVVRFALRDEAGKPIAVCGVAAPLAQAWLARSECARLMRIDRLSRLDERALGDELLEEWGLTRVLESARDRSGSTELSAEAAGEQFTAIVAELDGALSTSARLDQQLAEERRQVLALREASILAGRRASELLGTVTAERTRSGELEQSLVRAEGRLGELQSERDSERSRAEQGEASAAEAAARERKVVETLRVELVAAHEELGRARTAAAEAPTPEELQAERGRAHEAGVDAEQAREEAASSAAELDAERRAVAAVRADLRAAQKETERARKASAQAPTRETLDQERIRAEQAEAALGDERVRAEQAEAALGDERGRVEKEEAKARSALGRAQDELARAHADAAASTAALAAEQQQLESLRAELTAVRKQLGGAKHSGAKSLNTDELEQLRSRAEKSEAVSEEACEEAAATAVALDAERATVESLRSKLREAGREIKRAERSATQLTAEMQLSSAAALEAEHEAVEALRADLRAAQQESERARGAAAQAPTKKALEQERLRAEQAEAALGQQRVLAEQADAEALSALGRARDELARARADAAARTAALTAEQQGVEALRAELTAVREELGGAQQSAARNPNAAELEQLRLRAKESEAGSEEAAATAAALDAERVTVESLRSKLREASREIKRAERSAAQVTAEMEASADLQRDRELAEQAEAQAQSALAQAQSALAQARDEQKRTRATAAASSAALAAEQQRVRELQTELESAAEEFKRMQHAADAMAKSAPARKKLDHERTRAERAEVALEAQRAGAEQAIASAVQEVAKEAALGAAEIEAHKQTILTLRTELSDSRDRAQEPVSGGPAWDAASQRDLSAALGGVTEWRTALKRAAKILGSEGRWDAVVAWCPEERRNFMKCAAMWIGDDAALAEFETQTWQHRRDPSATEFGRAREHTAPTCLLELPTADDALLKAAARVGMCSALLIPVQDGNQTICMLELLSRTPTSPSSQLILSLEGVALQLGAVAQMLGSAASASWRTGRM